MTILAGAARPREVSKKICLLGDLAVGKTSLVDRLVYNRFAAQYVSTIGVRVSQKKVVVPLGDDPVTVSLMLWDLAGGEEFDRVRQSYLRGATGALLVCDLTRPDTLARLADHAAETRRTGCCAELVVLANKADLEEQRAVPVEQVAEAARVLGAPWFLTSAKTGANVEAAFRELARRLMSNVGPG